MKYSYHVDVEYLCVVHYSISPGSSEAQARSYSRGLSPAKCCVMSQVQSDNYYRTDSIISTERQRSLSQDYHDQFVYKFIFIQTWGAPPDRKTLSQENFPGGARTSLQPEFNFLTLTAIVQSKIPLLLLHYNSSFSIVHLPAIVF